VSGRAPAPVLDHRGARPYAWAVQPRTTNPLIEVDALRVRYGTRWALDGLSFSVASGELVGLLGPNGAGKTTALSVLATLRRPTGGTARVAGHAVDRARAAVRRAAGLVPQSIALYPPLTARENLLFFARVAALRGAGARHAVDAALDTAGLLERADDVVATFSGGMQRRLNLAAALLHAPRVLLLDEPTVGVDPQSRERIFAAVRAHAASGAAVLYSTHYMEEAERLCDRVVLIDGGRAVAEGAPAALIRRARHGLRLIVVTRRPLVSGWLDGIAGAAAIASAENGGVAVHSGAAAHVAIADLTVAGAVLGRAAAAGGDVLEFHLHQPTLQDVFIELTGRALRD
jgi:ABC-2 type transport system ATP-binding protein